MLQASAVRAAVKSAQLAICEYHATVNNISLKPKRDRIYWHAGRGWVIGAVVYPGDTEKVVDYFDKMQRRWRQKTLDYERGLSQASAQVATPGEAHP